MLSVGWRRKAMRMFVDDLHPERLLEAALVVDWLELAGGTAGIDTLGAVLLASLLLTTRAMWPPCWLRQPGLGGRCWRS
jgi:hypothetical protein